MPTEPTTETPGAPQQQPQGNRFFAWMRSIGLTRQPGWIGGVASGIALRLNIDPLVVRGIIVVVALLGAPMLLLYAAAWMLLPDHTGKIHAEELGNGRFEPPVAGAGVMVLLELIPGGNIAFPFIGPIFPWWNGNVWPWAVGDGFFGVFWTLAIVGSAIWLVVALSNRAGNTPTATPMPPADGDAAGSDGATAAYPTAAYPAATTTSPTAATVPLVAPDVPASEAPTDPADLAAWQQQQAKFKQERDEYVRTNQDAQRAAMAAAAEERRRANAARAAAYRSEHERTRSHPLFTLSAIGLSLIVGALVLFAVGEGALTEQSLTAGLASMLAVLAVAIIINGIIGKRSGGSSGLAVVVAITLVATSVSPFGSHVTVFGSSDYEAEYSEDRDEVYFAGFGDTTIDLEEYWQGTRSGTDLREIGEVRVFSGFGDVTVIVPDNEYIALNLNVGGGRLEVEGSTADQNGLLRSLNEILPSGVDRRSEADRELAVDVYAGFGNVTIITEGASR
ncbi:PspC domain-containing protein [Diaminobutyricimonas sp. LJ205]|uniref:PspC domain-containing protein n=1 Tax=Diaminobutyricimonas sp. LJ205 TaxID=2683590 RepID=UPI0012F4FFB6|nr:PspC domain-containing protein [Diaminobutyricimonas sp. LJ205]